MRTDHLWTVAPPHKQGSPTRPSPVRLGRVITGTPGTGTIPIPELPVWPYRMWIVQTRTLLAESKRCKKLSAKSSDTTRSRVGNSWTELGRGNWTKNWTEEFSLLTPNNRTEENLINEYQIIHCFYFDFYPKNEPKRANKHWTETKGYTEACNNSIIVIQIQILAPAKAVLPLMLSFFFFSHK